LHRHSRLVYNYVITIGTVYDESLKIGNGLSKVNTFVFSFIHLSDTRQSTNRILINYQNHCYRN